VEFPPNPEIVSPDPTAAPVADGKPVPAVYIPNAPIPPTALVGVRIQKMEDPNITGASVTLIDSGLAVPPVGAAIANVIFIPGGDWDILSVELDLTGAASGELGALLFTNECGCCSALALIIMGDPP